MPVKDFLYKRLGLVAASGMQKKSVCRCLFGPPDHDELKRDLQIQLKADSDQVKSKLGFDSELDKPIIGGIYDWKLVDENEYVPDYYRKQYRPTRTRNIRATLPLDVDTPVMRDLDTPPSSPETSTVTSALSSRLEPEEVELDETLRRENETTPEAKITRQSTIDEFMRVRKRRRLDDDDDDQGAPDGKMARH